MPLTRDAEQQHDRFITIHPPAGNFADLKLEYTHFRKLNLKYHRGENDRENTLSSPSNATDPNHIRHSGSNSQSWQHLAAPTWTKNQKLQKHLQIPEAISGL